MNVETSHLSIPNRRVLDFVRAFIAEHDYAPSVRDIATGVRRSCSTVKYNLDVLEREGYIKRDRGVARSIRLTEMTL